ncbi:MAG TPA: DnaB-like helicase C-terminal domain-containing protein [Mycobacterium sp.]|nr:DnaB-like helicase C-terminal domain-containing protein [Mycobacterium sp.]
MTDTITPVPTGFRHLDELLRGGLHPGSLTIVAARSGEGASTFAYTILRNTAIRHERSSYLATTQESHSSVIEKLAGAEADVDTSHIHRRNVSAEERERIEAQRSKIAAMPLLIDDTTHMSMPHIRIAMRKLQHRNGLEFAVIDTILPIDASPSAPHFTDEWNEQMAPSLRELARSFRIPVLATLHMNWPEDGSDRAPQMCDMPEGSFEQYADTLLTLHVTDPNEHRRNARGTWGVTVTVAKNSHGRTGDLELFHEGPYSRFRDDEPEASPS